MKKFAVLSAAVALVALAQAQPKAQQKLKVGEKFHECRNCPEMVVVPAGTFMMGSPASDPEHRDNEPQQKITFAKPFAVGATEVTWDQWEACVRDKFCDGLAVENALRSNEKGEPNPDFKDWGRGTRPAVGLSWFDAQDFVGWLNKKTGSDDAYRLLSDAEWEYVARAGTTTAYWWGDKIDHNYGNFGLDDHTLGPKVEGRDQWANETAPVASFPPNPWGVYDMHGNIFEWVEDCNEPDRKHAKPDGSANKEGNCATRSFRSGSFVSNPYMQRSAKRTAPYPSTRRGRNYLGTRVAKTLD
jgi:formylglycine-generating enzyme required for sulfatase activity